MKFLPDTNVFIGLAAGKEILRREIRHVALTDIALSAVVLHELYFGAYKSMRTSEALRNIAELRVKVLPFEPDDARCAAKLRAVLARHGTPIGPLDALIAGQALARDLTLVTRNTREFLRVEGVRVENWEA